MLPSAKETVTVMPDWNIMVNVSVVLPWEARRSTKPIATIHAMETKTKPVVVLISSPSIKIPLSQQLTRLSYPTTKTWDVTLRESMAEL